MVLYIYLYFFLIIYLLQKSSHTRLLFRPINLEAGLIVKSCASNVLANDRDGALSHKLDYLTYIQYILNFKEHTNCIFGSKGMMIGTLFFSVVHRKYFLYFLNRPSQSSVFTGKIEGSQTCVYRLIHRPTQFCTVLQEFTVFFTMVQEH